MTTNLSEDNGDVLDFFIARQPVLDRRQKLTAYELLFRRASTGAAHVTNDISATATVIAHASKLGLVNVIGALPGFINVDTKVLMSDFIQFLPFDKVFLEVLETVRITDELITRIKQLKLAGYRFVIDDVTADTEELRRLLPFVDMIKIDIMEISRQQVSGLFHALKGYNKKMLAEKVETLEDFAFCHELGFDLFQGYFFSKPKVLTGKKLHTGQLSVVNILNKLIADAEINEIETAIKKDAGLALNLIRLVNTAAFMTQQRIATIRQAINVLGRRQLQRWLQILMYADADQSDSFMSPLLILATTRGRLMELMAQKTGSHDHLSSDTAFTVGIMSLINVLFDTPMVQLLAQISVSDDIKKALINRTGIYGDMLQLVIDLECVSDEEELPKAGMQKLQLQIDDLRTMQLRAYEFSNSIGMDVVEDQ